MCNCAKCNAWYKTRKVFIKPDFIAVFCVPHAVRFLRPVFSDKAAKRNQSIIEDFKRQCYIFFLKFLRACDILIIAKNILIRA